MGAPQILLFFFSFGFNLLIYGLLNRNIAALNKKNIKNAFWLGILGPLGMIIVLFQSVTPTVKKVLFGVGRFLILAITLQVLGELGIIQDSIKGILTYLIGFPFILRGKYIFSYSTDVSNDG